MRLGDLAPGMKGRNAGASWLTFDIAFKDLAAFERAVASGVIDAALIAGLYGVREDEVRIFVYRPAQAIKVTIPRASFAGGIEESDFDGAQQFAPLLDVEIP